MKHRDQPIVLPRERLLRIARHVYDGGVLTHRWIMVTFNVSISTAKEDLRMASLYLPLEYTRPNIPPQAGQQPKAVRLATRIIRT